MAQHTGSEVSTDSGIGEVVSFLGAKRSLGFDFCPPLSLSLALTQFHFSSINSHFPPSFQIHSLTSHHITNTESERRLLENIREMSGKGKAKRDEQDGASDGGDSEGHAPPKKSLKKNTDEDSDSIVVCEVRSTSFKPNSSFTRVLSFTLLFLERSLSLCFDFVKTQISKNRRVAVRNWQGKIMVDIREFFLKDGKQLPGKKGDDSTPSFHFLNLNLLYL